MESIYRDINEGRLKNTNEIIQRMAHCLDNGGDINHLFPQRDFFKIEHIGTILHSSIKTGKTKIVEYALSKGANIACKITSSCREMIRYEDALEVAGQKTLYRKSQGKSIFQILKQRSLDLYSSHGLTPFHIDCAIEMDFWSKKSIQDLQTAELNATVSTSSPLWPGLTPILIAAKCENKKLVKRLLYLGADPLVRDPEGNTPLHYLYHDVIHRNKYTDVEIDERLFFKDGRNTFGTYNSLSHFHIAGMSCPDTLDIVKRYLDQGISPDLPLQDSDEDQGPSLKGALLHGQPELVRLLLEYGAEIDGTNAPIELAFDQCNDVEGIRCICVLIEAGANMEGVDLERCAFIDTLDESNDNVLLFLKCIRRLLALNKNLVPEKFMKLDLEKSEDYCCLDELNRYSMSCLEELKTLPDPCIRQILDETIAVRPDFEERLRWLLSFDFKPFPIYGSMLRLKTKRKLFEYEKKKRIIPQAIPQIQSLVQSLCSLPQLCADNILWN